MKKLIALVSVAMLTLALTLATVAPALADCKPGLQGCEGQPGNQGGPQHHP